LPVPYEQVPSGTILVRPVRENETSDIVHSSQVKIVNKMSKIVGERLGQLGKE
jgi:hypothetical protein